MSIHRKSKRNHEILGINSICDEHITKQLIQLSKEKSLKAKDLNENS